MNIPPVPTGLNSFEAIAVYQAISLAKKGNICVLINHFKHQCGPGDHHTDKYRKYIVDLYFSYTEDLLARTFTPIRPIGQPGWVI